MISFYETDTEPVVDLTPQLERLAKDYKAGRLEEFSGWRKQALAIRKAREILASSGCKSTFADWCAGLGISTRHAQRLDDACKLHEQLDTAVRGVRVPSSERLLRPLVDLRDVDKAVTVVTAIVQDGKDLTHSGISEYIDVLYGNSKSATPKLKAIKAETSLRTVVQRASEEERRLIYQDLHAEFARDGEPTQLVSKPAPREIAAVDSAKFGQLHVGGRSVDAPQHLITERMQKAVAGWVDTGKRNGQNITPLTLSADLQVLAQFEENKAFQLITDAIKSCWKTINQTADSASWKHLQTRDENGVLLAGAADGTSREYNPGMALTDSDEALWQSMRVLASSQRKFGVSDAEFEQLIMETTIKIAQRTGDNRTRLLKQLSESSSIANFPHWGRYPIERTRDGEQVESDHEFFERETKARRQRQREKANVLQSGSTKSSMR
ncbi:MAG: hypothetical protein ABJZ55_16150 [Fuerstiella sp.]